MTLTTRVVLPERNKKDLIDLPKKAKSDLEFIFVKHIDEVLEVALLPKAEKPAKSPKPAQPVKPKKDDTQPPVQPGV